jgi:site-specific DNA-cytosine methylase
MSYTTFDLSDTFDYIEAEIATSKNVTALGGCIFAGGFSVGFEQAGINVVGHLELPDLALGAEVSKQLWPVAVAPLNDEYAYGRASDKAMGLTWMGLIDRLKSLNLSPDIMHFNPPCVAFAGTGKHQGSKDDRMCYTRYCAYETAMKMQPSVWTWELVPGVYTRERNFLDAMAFRAKRMGYRSYAFLTSSAMHGGFQNRKRFHFVASKYELDFEGTYDSEPEEHKRSYNLGDALALAKIERQRIADELSYEDDLNPELLGLLPNDVNSYNGAFNSIMKFCCPGSHLRDVSTQLMYDNYRPKSAKWSGKGLPGFGHTRARMDRVSPNILGGHTVIHPTENRYLTARECAFVQGFPARYVFSNGSKAYQEIGRGLCSHNARFLGKVIRNGIMNGIRTVPTLSKQKGHEDSWMETIDWRNTAKTSGSIRSSHQERVDWWKANHPNIPVPEDISDQK